jgi:hypothetical protein
MESGRAIRPRRFAVGAYRTYVDCKEKTWNVADTSIRDSPDPAVDNAC